MVRLDDTAVMMYYNTVSSEGVKASENLSKPNGKPEQTTTTKLEVKKGEAHIIRGISIKKLGFESGVGEINAFKVLSQHGLILDIR